MTHKDTLFKYVQKKGEKGEKGEKAAAKHQPAAGKLSGLQGFNAESVKRQTQKSTVALKLSQMEEFEYNPRQDYDAEEMEQLKSSIRKNGEIDQIQVVHIVKGDKYIVADGHRTRRAMIAVHGEGHKAEVIVQKEFQEYGEEAKKHLLTVGIVTSFTKVNLKVWEQLDAVVKYLDMCRAGDPTREWAVTQHDVFDTLGLSREKAMRLGRILANIPKKQWKAMQEKEISESLLLSAIQISRSKDEGMKNAVLSEMEAGNVTSPLDVESMGAAWDAAQRSVPDNVPEREKVVRKAAVENFRKEKRAAGRIDPKTDSNARAAAEIVKIKKKFQNLVATVDVRMLDDGARQAFTEALMAIRETADEALSGSGKRNK